MDSSKPEYERLSHVAVALGSNCGSREEAVADAFGWLSGILAGARWSGVYETDPLSGEGGKYMNAVATGYTSLSADQLIAMTKRYEREQGRDEECRLRGAVPIDIDVVVFDDKIIRPADYTASYFLKGLRLLSPSVAQG